MTDTPFACLQLVELYDGAGHHLGGLYPPLMVDNQLTQAFHDSKALRPAWGKLVRFPEDADLDLAFVWMLPMAMPKDTPLPAAIAGELVAALDARRTVVMHGDDLNGLCQVQATLSAFVGGGHV